MLRRGARGGVDPRRDLLDGRLPGCVVVAALDGGRERVELPVGQLRIEEVLPPVVLADPEDLALDPLREPGERVPKRFLIPEDRQPRDPVRAEVDRRDDDDARSLERVERRVVGAVATFGLAALLWTVSPQPLGGAPLLMGLVAFWSVFISIIALPHVVVGAVLDRGRGIWHVP